MFFPEFLYQLSPRDQQVTWLDPVITRVAVAVASINPIAVFTVPADRCLILQTASMEATPGLGQNVAQQFLFTRSQGGGQNFTFRSDVTPGAANTTLTLDWSGSILVPANWTVQGSGVFNAGAVANGVVLMLHGILIPVSNIQRL